MKYCPKSCNPKCAPKEPELDCSEETDIANSDRVMPNPNWSKPDFTCAKVLAGGFCPVEKYENLKYCPKSCNPACAPKEPELDCSEETDIANSDRVVPNPNWSKPDFTCAKVLAGGFCDNPKYDNHKYCPKSCNPECGVRVVEEEDEVVEAESASSSAGESSSSSTNDESASVFHVAFFVYV